MNIKITRKKKRLVARLIPYYCIINYDIEDFKKYIKEENYALNDNAMENIDYNPLSLNVAKNMPRAFSVEKFKAHLENKKENVEIVLIKNGETKTIELDNKKTPILVASFTSTGVVFSNQVLVSENSVDKSYLIVTKYNWKTGSEILIYNK